HADGGGTEADRRVQGDGTTEAVTDDDEAPRAVLRRQRGGVEGILDALLEQLRLAITDAQGADPAGGELAPEVVVQPAGRAEQAAHGASHGDHGAFVGRIAVPQHRQQPGRRVLLDVVKPVGDLDRLDHAPTIRGRMSAIWPRSTASARWSISVGSAFTMTTRAPLCLAMGTTPATGHTPSVVPTVSMRSHSSAA